MDEKDESITSTDIGWLGLIVGICTIFLLCATLSPKNNPINPIWGNGAQTQSHKTEIENEKNYLLYHPKPFTLKESVVTKTFTPQIGKYSPDDSVQDVSAQASGYLKAIKNIKDYTVRVNTNGNGLFDEASKTITLNRK